MEKKKNLVEVFPDFTTSLKTYMTLPVTSCESESNFSKLSIIKNKFRSTMLKERLNYRCILSTDDDMTKSLSYEEAIKEHAAKN